MLNMINWQYEVPGNIHTPPFTDGFFFYLSPPPPPNPPKNLSSASYFPLKLCFQDPPPSQNFEWPPMELAWILIFLESYSRTLSPNLVTYMSAFWMESTRLCSKRFLGLSAHSRHFLLFGHVKIGVSAKNGRRLWKEREFLCGHKGEKCFKSTENPTETLATNPLTLITK